MADYIQHDTENRRVRFFDGQYLVDQDFVDEQKYHLDRQRRLARTLGVSGVVRELGVSFAAQSGGTLTLAVTVTAGEAVDGKGRALVLDADTTVYATHQPVKRRPTEVSVWLAYREASALQETEGERDFRRFDETPALIVQIGDVTAYGPPDAQVADADAAVAVRLATANAIGAGIDAQVTDEVLGPRSGLVSPGGPISSATGSPVRVDGGFVARTDGSASLSVLPAEGTVVSGPLRVDGTGGTSEDLTVNGRIASNSSDGGLSIAGDRLVGGYFDGIGLQVGDTWRLVVDGEGRVGVGTADPEHRLDVNGGLRATDVLTDALHVRIPGAETTENALGELSTPYYVLRDLGGLVTTSAGAVGTDTQPSDLRLKRDVRALDGALDRVHQLHALRFRWSPEGLEHLTRGVPEVVSPGASDEENRALTDGHRREQAARIDRERVGLSAQDVREALPEAVGEDDAGYLRVDYGAVVALLVEALKEQQVAIEALRRELAGR